MKTRELALTLAFVVATFTADAQAVTIPTVPVGNAGNAGEVQSQGTFGAVADNYRIGTTEVTNAQYTGFLNAKAASDPLGLYNISMGSGLGGGVAGITQSGLSGSFTYSTISGREDKPVNFVSWYDSIRFANWLHNGQGSGDTETGAYTLLGGTATPSNGLSITRNSGALWWLTSEDEWYKAAYHKNDGVTGNYFDYPTSSDTVPTAEAPPGGSNSANYNIVVGDVTDAGAYVDSDSPYGTFDQGGNVWDWNEALISGSLRGLRGGAFLSVSGHLLSQVQQGTNPVGEDSTIGFRVATVPEPSTITLAGLDIRPGGDQNPVNLKSLGVLPVALLTTGEFDALQVDLASIVFGDPVLLSDGAIGVAPLRSKEKDVDHDGLTDVMLKFSMRDLVDNGALGGMSMEAILTGELLDGTPFEGSDSIRLVPPGDANNDQIVNAGDYTTWADNFGTNGNDTPGDFNEDRKVDAGDYIIWANNFGTNLSAPQRATAAVPEPSTLTLAGLGLIGLFAYGWRRRRRA